MNKRNKIALAIAAVALMGAVGYKTTVAIARADEISSHPMIQVLSERFGLNETEVEEALDEIRAEHFAQMQSGKEERLDQAVADGVITEQQRQALQDKWEEMHANRTQERQQHQEEMQSWFEENGIDHEALRQYGGLGQKGFGHRLGGASGSESRGFGTGFGKNQ